MPSLRPDEADYADRVRVISRVIHGYSKPLYVELADRSTIYKMVLFPAEELAIEAWPSDPGSAVEATLTREGPGWLYVGLLEHGSYWFNLDSFLAPTYVGEKLGINSADGEVIAEFLTRLGAARRMKIV
jgi:hypothetical protein